MQPLARCSNHQCVYIDQCGYVLFQLKPYVPYNAPEINQSKFTARDLFDQCYAPQIEKDFKAGKITYEPTEDKDTKKEDT